MYKNEIRYHEPRNPRVWEGNTLSTWPSTHLLVLQWELLFFQPPVRVSTRHRCHKGEKLKRLSERTKKVCVGCWRNTSGWTGAGLAGQEKKWFPELRATAAGALRKRLLLPAEWKWTSVSVVTPTLGPAGGPSQPLATAGPASGHPWCWHILQPT